jgi:PKD repeat protein
MLRFKPNLPLLTALMATALCATAGPSLKAAADCAVTAQFGYSSINHSCYFTDESSAGQDEEIVSWHWDFGDGNSSTLPQPTYVYQEYGTYDCCLTVASLHSDGTSCDQTFCMDVVIQPMNPCALEVEYTYTPLSNGLVAFESQCQGLNGTAITGLSWAFASEGGSSFPNPSFQFPDASHYDVCLTATGTAGGQSCSTVICKSVEVDNFIYELDPSFKTTQEGCSIVFDYNGYNGTFTEATAWTWDMGDGNVIENELLFDYQYEQEGTYTVCLVVSGTCPGNECSAQVCKEVMVSCPNTDFEQGNISEMEGEKDEESITLSMNQEIDIAAQFEVFPNPCGGLLQLRLPENTEEIRLFDLQGRLIEAHDISHLVSMQLDLSHLENGNYVVAAILADRIITKTLIVFK